MPTAYDLVTGDVVIPLVELLGKYYNETRTHPLAFLESVANLAVAGYAGKILSFPIDSLALLAKEYTAGEDEETINYYTMQIWARVYAFISTSGLDLTDKTLTILSISGGDLRITFETF